MRLLRSGVARSFCGALGGEHAGGADPPGDAAIPPIDSRGRGNPGGRHGGAPSMAPPDGKGVPDAVRHFLERAVSDALVPRQIRITQHGEMRRTPTGRRMRFTATQFLAVERIAFSWQARFPIAGPLAITVVDECSRDQGRLVVRLLGYPIGRQEGPETATGEAIRYLAELPLVPFAMAHNPDLEWRDLGDRRAEVAATVRGERLTVKFDFDATGDIVRASSESRPMLRAGELTTAPWGGEFQDYGTFNGIRVPTRAQAYWDLPEGRFVYWRGTITSALALDRPFGTSQ